MDICDGYKKIQTKITHVYSVQFYLWPGILLDRYQILVDVCFVHFLSGYFFAWTIYVYRYWDCSSIHQSYIFCSIHLSIQFLKKNVPACPVLKNWRFKNKSFLNCFRKLNLVSRRRPPSLPNIFIRFLPVGKLTTESEGSFKCWKNSDI